MTEHEVFEMFKRIDGKLDTLTNNCLGRVERCAQVHASKASNHFVTWAIGLIALFLLALGGLATSTKVEQVSQRSVLNSVVTDIEIVQHTLDGHLKEYKKDKENQ